MFDGNSEADLLALNSEVTTDPISMGYVLNNTPTLVDQLNNPDSNVGPTESTRTIDDVLISEVSEVIDQTEYAALPEYDKEWLKAFISLDIRSEIRNYKSKMLAIFPAGTTTRTAIVDLLDVADSSRAEVLFGWGSVITRNDLIKAREIA